MWSGNIAFGLVHIPVKLYAATEDRDVRFHQVHLADGGRIKYERRCQTCGEAVSFAEIGKGYEDDTGRRVVLTDEELDSLQVEHGRDLEIVQFVPAEQVDPIHFERAYYLEPAKGAAKPYVLLRRALEQTDRIALVMMTLRKRSRLAVLRIRDDVVVMQTMLWPDEVRVPEFQGIADDDVAVRPQELAMAGSLVESLGGDFDPSQYRDEYREAVLAHVEQRLAGEDVIQPVAAAAAEDSGTVVDLMAALQESVRRQQQAQATAGGADEPTADEGPAKRPPAKRATKRTSQAKGDDEDGQDADKPARRPATRKKAAG
ncbi:MAG: Ku protein [Candidatus Nanopelagicales bacterium]|jgi:DNA end-binding protein Ku|nr:Ku protein [Candidatus Nanopelagicales bacterium]